LQIFKYTQYFSNGIYDSPPIFSNEILDSGQIETNRRGERLEKSPWDLMVVMLSTLVSSASASPCPPSPDQMGANSLHTICINAYLMKKSIREGKEGFIPYLAKLL
jgi:hypothetical protein